MIFFSSAESFPSEYQHHGIQGVAAGDVPPRGGEGQEDAHTPDPAAGAAQFQRRRHREQDVARGLDHRTTDSRSNVRHTECFE